MPHAAKVLLVDDDPVLVRVLQHCLSSSELSVISSPTAAEATELINKEGFTALIADALPGYEELIRYFRQRNPRAPAMILTGGISPEQDEAARQAGAELVLFKPNGVEALKQSVLDLVVAAHQSIKSLNDRQSEVVLALERKLFAASLAGDLPTLESLFADEYLFASSSRGPETKRARLSLVESGRLKYTAVDVKRISASHYGNVCIVKAMVDIAGVRDEQDISSLYDSVRVYSRRGQEWKAVAGQFTRCMSYSERSS
jgi:CheY-like chemotaxis protein